MPLACVLGNIDTGHGSFPPTPVTSSSPNVFHEKIPATRLGDSLASHGSPSPSAPHGRAVASGSSTVFINGRAATRIGDAISCGGSMSASNSTVFIGG